LIPLAVPNISGNEEAYLQECVRTNFVSSVGPFVSQFEAAVANETGAAGGVATCSGTAGLHLALTALGVSRGDLVISPSFTFIATANAISHCGAEPWLFDSGEESWTLDIDQVRDRLAAESERFGAELRHKRTGKRISAIMVVYTLGHPGDMDGLKKIARDFNLPILADGAAALGAAYKNKPLADLADLTVFSFNGNKTITAGGGGMVVGNDSELVNRMRHLSTTARVGEDYHHDAVGFNYRLTNLQAAVGCAHMERLEEFVAKKRQIAAIYNSELGEVAGVKPFPAARWASSACWFSGVSLEAGITKSLNEVCNKLKSRGIDAKMFWKPIHMQAPYMRAEREEMATTEATWERVLTLPCSTSITADEQAYVIDAVRSVIGH